MPKTIHTAWSTNAIVGFEYPRVAAWNGHPWFLWSAPVSESMPRLESHGPHPPEQTELVLARQTEDGRIKRIQAFQTPGDAVRPRDLCVSDRGALGLWTLHDGTTSRFMAGNDAGKTQTLLRDARVRDASAVPLEDGSMVIGVVRLHGKTPCLRFFRIPDPDTLQVEPIETMTVEGAWSVSLAALDGERFWVAFDSYTDDRFQAAVGVGDRSTGTVTSRSLPGTGFAVDPFLVALPGREACVVWSEDKAWGAHEYDFKRKTRLPLARVTEDAVLFCEEVPLPTAEWDDDEQQMPCSPTAVALDDGLHVFFRRPRAAMESAARINDWGWQLWESVRDTDGTWHEARLFSHEVSSADDSLGVVRLSGRKAAAIYHACSFDRLRTYTHGHRLHLAEFACSPLTAPAEKISYPSIPAETRPRLAERPVVQVDGKTLHCYWGDLHRHSLVSKCIPEHDGSYDDHIRFALGCRGFDFYSITDHVESQISDHEWQRLLAVLDAANEDGHFAAVYGFEGPNHLVRGHLNFYFLDREAAEFGYRELRTLESLEEVERACRECNLLGRVFCVRHFHADALSHDDIIDGSAPLRPGLDWVVEAVQGRGYSPEAIHALLRAGFRFGFIGSTDHNRPPGHPRGGIGIYEQAIAGVWAEDLSRKGLFAALHDRHCFSSNGPALATCMRVNDTFMGGTVQGRKENAIEVEIVPTTELIDVCILRDGEIIATEQRRAAERTWISFADGSAAPGEHVYYARVTQAPEPGLAYPGISWTSPVWVTA